MKCPYCGNFVVDGATYCPDCGGRQTAPSGSGHYSNPSQNTNPYGQTNPNAYGQMNPYSNPYTGPDPNARRPEPAQGLATASLVLGILSLFCFCFGIVPAVLAIVFAGFAKNQGNKSGIATAGMVCGIIGLIPAIISWAIIY